MIHEFGWKNLQATNMLYKINEIANVPNKEILIPADSRTRSKHGHKVHIMTNKQMNTNIHFP